MVLSSGGVSDCAGALDSNQDSAVNEKPEPRWNSSGTTSKEEASSRLEALLKSTSSSEKLTENQQISSQKRYRSSIRIMVRPEAVSSLQKPLRSNSSDGLSRSSSSSTSSSTSASNAKKLSASGVKNMNIQDTENKPQQRAIVKEQFR